MNYLGHAYLSFGQDELLLGNMIGDFVKGTSSNWDIYPAQVRKGLMLHRQIDTYTDAHTAIREAKKIFRKEYGLYSGAIVDTLIDHFIANDPSLFAHSQQLQKFVDEVYHILSKQSDLFPEKFVPYYQSMIKHNWLYHYISEQGIHQSLRGLMRKAKHIEEVDTAFQLFLDHKPAIEKLYQAFFGDITCYVKNEIRL